MVILFSTRHNLLLLLGQKFPILNSFSHSTYLILHRWIGRLVALLAVIHSVLSLPLYIDSDEPRIFHFPFCIWGAYFRRRFYEPFLLGHILLSIIVLVGCWYRVQDLRLSGIAPLVRTVRVVMNGIHKARVTEFGNGGEYIRVDIPLDTGKVYSARPGLHVYAQFPSLDGWKRPWQNHPFSVVPFSLLGRIGGESGSSSPTDERLVSIHGPDGDAEKGLEVRVAELKTSTTDTGSGITLLVKKSKGVTSHLKACDGLLTLLDGPYPNKSTTKILNCERLLLIGGRIGITGVLPWIAHHSNVKLAWSMKESARCLVEQVEPALEMVAEKDVRVARRLDLEQLLADEVNMGWSRVGVVVSGPAGLCDDARVAVASAGRKTQGKTVLELEVDAYSW
ncbi:ferric reductase transmembrane component 4 [Rhypophila sp. PSN 637]